MARFDTRFLMLALSAVLISSGCGGSGGGGTTNPNPTTTPVKYSIAWGARSRAIQGPSSALSARLTLTGAGETGGDVAALVNRNGGPAAYTGNYTTATSAKTSTYPMTLRFYANANGTGAVVGEASTNVTIAADGSGIGDVTVTGTIHAVVVDPGQSVHVPTTKQLTFTARTAGNAIVAVTPGSGTWTLVSGSEHVSLTPDGVATPVMIGPASVRVSVDGIASANETVSCTENPDGALIVLNFDEHGAMPSVPTDVPVPAEARVLDDYLNSAGVRISSSAGYATVVQLREGEAPSPDNALAGSTDDGLLTFSSAHPITFTFFDRTTHVAGATKFFSLACDHVGKEGQTAIIRAYDVDGNLLDTVVTDDVGGQVLSMSFNSPVIHRVEFTRSEGSNDGISPDDVTFRPVVPAQ